MMTSSLPPPRSSSSWTEYHVKDGCSTVVLHVDLMGWVDFWVGWSIEHQYGATKYISSASSTVQFPAFFIEHEPSTSAFTTPSVLIRPCKSLQMDHRNFTPAFFLTQNRTQEVQGLHRCWPKCWPKLVLRWNKILGSKTFTPKLFLGVNFLGRAKPNISP